VSARPGASLRRPAGATSRHTSKFLTFPRPPHLTPSPASWHRGTKNLMVCYYYYFSSSSLSLSLSLLTPFFTCSPDRGQEKRDAQKGHHCRFQEGAGGKGQHLPPREDQRVRKQFRFPFSALITPTLLTPLHYSTTSSFRDVQCPPRRPSMGTLRSKLFIYFSFSFIFLSFSFSFFLFFLSLFLFFMIVFLLLLLVHSVFFG